MARVPQKYNVTTRHNPNPDWVRIQRGYTILVKIAIRIIEQEKNAVAG